jgi:hypothetical protein
VVVETLASVWLLVLASVALALQATTAEKVGRHNIYKDKYQTLLINSSPVLSSLF